MIEKIDTPAPQSRPDPLNLQAANLAGELGQVLDGCEDATPADLMDPAYSLWMVVQAHIKDAHDTLRILQGEVTPTHPDWDIMPSDAQEAAATLYPVPHPIDNDCDADPSDADRVDALLARLEAAHV